MPKATVDKDDGAVAREDEVWSSGQVSTMKAEAIAETVHESAHDHLRLRVPIANRSHVAATLFLVVDVGH
jgi:hypothetical protein